MSDFVFPLQWWELLNHSSRPASIGLLNDLYPERATPILGCLTLPSLEELHTNDWTLLNSANLSAFKLRSSCPLTRITLCTGRYADEFRCPDVHPLPGMTDLVVEHMMREDGLVAKLLLERYLPDLLHLTLRLQPFRFLWKMGRIPLLLDRKRWQSDSDTQSGGRLRKFLVVDERYTSTIDEMWNSDVGK